MRIEKTSIAQKDSVFARGMVTLWPELGSNCTVKQRRKRSSGQELNRTQGAVQGTPSTCQQSHLPPSDWHAGY